MNFAGEAVTKGKLGFDFSNFHVTSWLEKTTTPTLILNSSIDEVIPPYMGEDLYKAISHHHKKLYTTDSYSHVEMYLKNPTLYKEVLQNFLEKNTKKAPLRFLKIIAYNALFIYSI